MPIAIATLGKFTGAPTRKMSAKYGGGTSAGIQYVDKHKFPIIRIERLNKESKNININIQKLEE